MASLSSDDSEWFFAQLEQLEVLRSSTSAVAPREEIIHRVFVKVFLENITQNVKI